MFLILRPVVRSKKENVSLSRKVIAHTITNKQLPKIIPNLLTFMQGEES